MAIKESAMILFFYLRHSKLFVIQSWIFSSPDVRSVLLSGDRLAMTDGGFDSYISMALTAARHCYATTLGTLFTPSCFCHQAV